MKRIFLITLAVPAALLAGKSDPGAPLVAADEAYAKAAHLDGEWPATRAFSLPQSEMFVPERVKVLEFGKDRSDSEAATRWRAEQAWISCDGSIGVTFGRWNLPGSRLRGWYQTIWARLTDGSYRLYLKHGGGNPRKLHSKPGRKGMRAACSGKPSLPITAPAIGTDYKLGASKDQTLIWSSAVTAKGSVQIRISLWDGTRHVPVLEDVAPAPAPR